MSNVKLYSKESFDSIKHFDDSGREYWLARELQIVLEYSQWRNFENVIERAKTACINSGVDISAHFADVSKMVNLGVGTERRIQDIALSRYACYLIVQNGDPRNVVGKKPRGDLGDADKCVARVRVGAGLGEVSCGDLH